MFDRNYSIDLIKCFAIFFVIGQHFFIANTYFLFVEYKGGAIFIQNIILEICRMAIPLFIITTGYLNNHIDFNKSFFWSFLKVLFTYILYSILTLLYRRYYLNETFSFIDDLILILSFKAIPYGWYVEMWIGLFLISPFINRFFSSIEGKNIKKLIIILFCLTALPLFLNRKGFDIFPDFWISLWPLLYYIIGKYINKYNVSISKKTIFFLPFIFLINPIANIIIPGTHSYYNFTGDYLLMVPTSLIFFILCLQINLNNSFLKKIIKKISILSFDIYLCCWIFDSLYYPILKKNNFISQSQFGYWFIIIVPIVLFSSLLFSQLIFFILKAIKIDKYFR